MGTISQGCPPQIQDLKVTLHHSSLVFPCQETQRKSLFLSNIDQVLSFNVQTVHFFPAHPNFPPETVAEKIKNTLEKILVPYDFLAGRLKTNAELGRLEIDCNAAGAGLVVASTEFTLDEIGDLVYPNPGFKQLIVTTLDNLAPGDDQPLCIFQVTSFKCGGFAMGILTNHVAFDGTSFRLFLDNLASLAAGKPLAAPPCNDRRLLAARSPPRVPFDHPELLPLKTPPIGEDPNPSVFESSHEDLHFRVIRLTSDQIFRLKQKAQSGKHGPESEPGSKPRATSFSVVAAHVWRCKALSCGDGNRDRVSTMLYAVDIRSRLRPALPAAYTGNAVLSGYARGTCGELEEGPLWRVVDRVYEGSERMTEEYARSAIDWGEVHKGFPNGEFLVSSWWRLGFAEVEYPWGRPRYSCPVVCRRKDIVLFFPDVHGSNGVNVLVALPPKEMDKFHSLFHQLLAESA
ncbi:acyltransferase GLAUCE [Malania oleifera]|uniref:acyltransferase GLAUCE n=1 Tax=Malania oleifera TaxID=397392 RepID=UPI0025ADE66D|nr:acyltransferase GLAUCE [Malania oleifera]XP_057961612.1 acyltransferase GLAUCE [Malania oleifera]